MNDADYLYAFQKIVMPIAYEFAPDFILGKSAWRCVCRISAFGSDSFGRL